jgi:hypothetical protein
VAAEEGTDVATEQRRAGRCPLVVLCACAMVVLALQLPIVLEFAEAASTDPSPELA